MDEERKSLRCFKYMREFGEEAIKLHAVPYERWILQQGLKHDRAGDEVRMCMTLQLADGSELRVIMADKPLFYESEGYDKENINRTARALGLDPTDVELRMERIGILREK